MADRNDHMGFGFPDSVHQAQLTWIDGLLALLAGGLALILYGRTVAPGLLPGDSGEFQALAYLLGNTHPTGYPVYLTLARLFTLLPIGELAYRVNLFSALLGALTISGVYLCGKLLTGYPATAFSGALALAVSATLWSQSLIAEVYSAGAAFFVLILFALLWWDASKSKWTLFAAGLLGGLGIGVHMSVALLAPAVLLFLLLHWDRGWPMWRTAALGALSGLALTILLFFLIDWNNPTANYFNSVVGPSHSAWGFEAEQIDGPLEQLLFSWQGRQFQHRMFSDIGEVMPEQAVDYWEDMGNELAPPLVLLAIAGMIYLLLRRPRVAALLLVALFFQLFYFFNYEIWDLYVFYIPSYVLLVLFAIAGLGALIDVIAYGLNSLRGRQSEGYIVLDISLALLVLVFAVWPTFQPRQEGFIAGEVSFAFRLYPEYDSDLKREAATTVAELPENSIVFTDWKMMWPYYYIAHVENDRRDLTFIETFPASGQKGMADSLVAYVIANIGEHPLFFEEPRSELEEMENISITPVRIGAEDFFAVTEER